jgi:TPR repeat protein
MSCPQGDRLWAGQVVKFAFGPAEEASMSDRGSGAPDAVVPFAPKSVARVDANDPLEKAGHLVLDMVRQAAGNAQASYQQAVETSRKLAGQLRGAEDRIKDLEARLRHQEDRADRAEKWLHHISVEIEGQFFGREKAASRS